jgi:hypothetical protein
MAQVNTILANTVAKNTGLVAKAFDPKRIAGALIVPKGYTLTAAQIATLQAKLTADAALDSKTQRIYPLSNLLDFKDNSEKPVVQAFSTGAETTVRDGVYKWGFQFTKGGQTLHSAVRVFNGASWDFLLVDDSNQIIGTAWIDGTGAQGVKAIPSIEIFTDAWMPNDGKKVTEYMTNFKFFPKYINEQLAFIQVDPIAEFDILGTVQGLKDATLKVTASATPGTYYCSIFDNTNENLFDELQAGLVLALWTLVNTVTGATITITSVTPDAANKRFVIVVTTADPDYPIAGQKITFNLVGPTELIAANVEGIESTGPVSIVRN